MIIKTKRMPKDIYFVSRIQFFDKICTFIMRACTLIKVKIVIFDIPLVTNPQNDI